MTGMQEAVAQRLKCRPPTSFVGTRDVIDQNVSNAEIFAPLFMLLVSSGLWSMLFLSSPSLMPFDTARVLPVVFAIWDATGNTFEDGDFAFSVLFRPSDVAGASG